jgi:4-amino-4-deoxy-L-arabinose transferase-like glycosyltransferase
MRSVTTRHAIAAIVAVALLVRIGVVLATPTFAPAGDATDYDRIAVSLATGGGFPASLVTAHPGPTAFRPPMLPLLLSLPYRITGVADARARWEAGRMLEAVLGAIAVWLICLIALRLWGRRAALVSGAIAAVYPPLLLVGSSLLSESLFIPVTLGAVLTALIQRDTGRLRWGVVTGVLVAVAALTRTSGFILALPLAFLVWTGRPRWSWPALRAPLALLLATVAALVPWTVRNAVQFHEFVPTSTEGGFALAGTYNPIVQGRPDYPAFWAPPVLALQHLEQRHPDWNEAQISDGLLHHGLDYIAAHPASILDTLYWDTVRMFNLGDTGFERWGARYEAYPRTLAVVSVYAFWMLALLAIAGAVLARGHPGRRAPAAFWWCPAALLLITLPFSGDTRYRSVADPFFVLLASFALIAAYRAYRRRVPAGAPETA